jgi:hypothetical protein
VRDTVLDLVPAGDSSFVGYVGNGDGGSILISNNLPGTDARALIRFPQRPDSVPIGVDTFRTYRVDSVRIPLTLQYRDSAVTGMRVYVYRVPVTLDSNATFAELDGNLTPANLIDSVVVPDSARSQTFFVSFHDTTLYKIEPYPADSGQLALGLKLGAARETGVRLGARGAAGEPIWESYVHADWPDSVRAKRLMTFPTKFTITTIANPPVPDPDQLMVGGIPSARALLRFKLPQVIQDSATNILRATLELVPIGPIYGLPGDTARLQLLRVLADVGQKSPTEVLTSGLFALPDVYSDTVRFEIPGLVTSWQRSSVAPQAVMIRLTPEAASFSLPIFASTRSPSGQPKLRITYAKSFDFGQP